MGVSSSVWQTSTGCTRPPILWGYAFSSINKQRQNKRDCYMLVSAVRVWNFWLYCLFIIILCHAVNGHSYFIISYDFQIFFSRFLFLLCHLAKPSKINLFSFLYPFTPLLPVVTKLKFVSPVNMSNQYLYCLHLILPYLNVPRKAYICYHQSQLANLLSTCFKHSTNST